MEWEGSKIKTLSKERNISINKLSEKIGVSRQTVNDWINGQIPKGNHLILLCQFFQINPGFFFNDTSSYLLVPVHRTRMRAKITAERQNDAISLAKDYLNLFKNFKDPEVVPSIRSTERNKENAMKVAKKLRDLSGISRGIPIDYEHTFKLAEHLGINLIFRTFPNNIKSYAFYTKICSHRIVFVNKSTKIIDLIFPLLHEFVHATRDDINIDNKHEYEKGEEIFCDNVSNFTQFPEEYVNMVYKSIKNFKAANKIHLLKGYANSNNHSLFGIVKAIENIQPTFNLKIGAVDSNLRNQSPTVGEIIIDGCELREYVHRLFDISRNFMYVISEQIDYISERKLAELLDIESYFDAKEIKSEIKKLAFIR